MSIDKSRITIDRCFMTRALVMLGRGSAASHIELPLLKRGNITLVTDFPELRYHDGKTYGGVPIPLDEKIWADLKLAYAQAQYSSGLQTTPEAEPTLWQRIKADLRTIFSKD